MRVGLKYAAAAALLSVVSYAPVQAGEPIDDAFEMARACRADYERFCPDVPPGQGRVAECLGHYRNDLSPRCYRAFTMAATIRACAPDYYRFCNGVPPGEGRVLECLSANAVDLSNRCSDALAVATQEFGHLPTAKYGNYYEPGPDDVDEGRQESTYRYERRYERYERYDNGDRYAHERYERERQYQEPEPEPLK